MIWLIIGAVLVLCCVLYCPFILSSRISREEEKNEKING